ncbi:cbb3-type cytochrome c oxidase subunit I [Rickettsia endosymbiont of Orchestes rusci]|uniref:cbb3-type cytochrome c oxidase subunit I n=1 Tax=Rickettsia endosymbiont of Orchestes rusci TaxID=3066250 RepID=UPI00313E684C
MISESIIEELQNNSLTAAWLKLGIISLGLAGVYSVILVILRTPQLASFFQNPEIFKSALIVHVNLSVLVWLLSITASIWSYGLSSKSSLRAVKDRAAIHNFTRLLRQNLQFFLAMTLNIYPKLAFLGTILIAISPIAGQNPVMNNYIPMLENIIFVLGLSLFGVATLLFAVNTIYYSSFNSRNTSSISLLNRQNWTSLMNFAILSTAIMFILTWVCFTCSYLQLQRIIDVIPIEIEFYYELLFWSGGHLLQFIYTQILMIIWVMLFEIWLGKKLRFQKFYLFLFWSNFIFSVLIVAGHVFYDIIDGEFKEYYTSHMKYFGGVAPIGCLVGMVLELLFLDSRLRGNDIGSGNDIKSCAKVTIICSSILFLFGGLIAFSIAGINVVIPAHYHGSIVGISIAGMGYCYIYSVCDVIPTSHYVIPARAGIRKIIVILNLFQNLLKKMLKQVQHNVRLDSRLRGNDIGSRSDIGSKNDIMSITICILTFGQILHITGLALAGGYGVLRKDASLEMSLSAKLLMGMMGGGGLIAIVGGLMFVFICGKNIFFTKANLKYIR